MKRPWHWVSRATTVAAVMGGVVACGGDPSSTSGDEDAAAGGASSDGGSGGGGGTETGGSTGDGGASGGGSGGTSGSGGTTADASAGGSGGPDAAAGDSGGEDGSIGSGGDGGPDASLTDASDLDGSSSAEASPDAFIPLPEGAAGFPPDGPARSCEGFDEGLGTKGLLPTGPTQEFVDAYTDAVGATAAGPFVIHFSSQLLDVTFSAFVAGVEPTLSSGAVQPTETWVEYVYSLSSSGSVYLPPIMAPFHIELEGESVAVAGIELSGHTDDTCSAIVEVTAMLFIEQSQGSIPFGGATLGDLLGPTNTDISPGVNNGWAVTLQGNTAGVTLP